MDMSSKTEPGFYAQPQMMPNAPPQYNSTIGPSPIHVQPPILDQRNIFVAPAAPVPLGPNSCRVTCPSCQQIINTRVTYESSSKTHLIAVILCVTTCCCCIPYLIDSCKSTQHTCSNCGAYLGNYNA